MISSKANEEKHARELMMGALDGELSPEQLAEFDQLLDRSPELREEWDQMRTVKSMTNDMSYRQPPEEVWDGYWQGTYRRFERGIGWILFSLGTIAICGFGLWQWLQAMWAETSLPYWLKLAIFCVALGGTILLVSVVREKWFTFKRDPYKGVHR